MTTPLPPTTPPSTPRPTRGARRPTRTSSALIRPAALALAVALGVALAGGVGCGRDRPTYPDSVEGLRALIDDARRGADTSELALPEPEAWFRATFGDPAAAARLAEDLAGRPAAASLAEALRTKIGEGMTEILVERFDHVGDPLATGTQSAALARRTGPLALYSVRLHPPARPHQGVHIHSFAYVDGGFRWLGPLTALTVRPADPGRTERIAELAAELRNVDREAFLRTGRLPSDDAAPTPAEVDAAIRSFNAP